MYKCCECAKEYEIKPDYCECGNDTFDEITIDKPQKMPDANEQNCQIQKTINTQKQQNPKDVLSRVFFAICIILSIFVILFLGNDTSNNQTNKNINEDKHAASIKKEVKNLPSIDEIWLESEVPQQNITNSSQKSDSLQNLSENTQLQPQIQIVKKIVYVPQSASKPNSTGTASKSPPDKNKNIIQNTVQKQKVQPQKSSPTKSKTQNSANSANLQVQNQPSQNDSQIAFNELKNYKISLRNKIASNINFAAIAGDGQSEISFKISQTGKLTDRNFSRLSTNDTLNDALYNAVMKTPAYNPPPAAYKNETLRICLKMYGGNFEIELN